MLTPGNDPHRGSLLIDALVALAIISIGMLSLAISLQNMGSRRGHLSSGIQEQSRTFSRSALYPDGSAILTGQPIEEGIHPTEDTEYAQ